MMDLKPVVQVMDIRIVQPQLPATIGDDKKELNRSRELKKGSIVQLTEFVCNTISDHFIIIIIDLNVILGKSGIIGDPKPFISNKNPSNKGSTMPMLEGPHEINLNENVDEPLASRKESSCRSQSENKKRKVQSNMDLNILAVAKDVSKIARMIMEKNKEDDMGACFEKLEKLGWGTGTPMCDTTPFLFGESADYRKLWLHLKPESCGNWVTNAGSQFGLLGCVFVTQCYVFVSSRC